MPLFIIYVLWHTHGLSIVMERIGSCVYTLFASSCNEGTRCLHKKRFLFRYSHIHRSGKSASHQL